MKKHFYHLGRNILCQSLGKALVAFLAFFTTYLLTRYLGKIGFGNFTLTLAYLSLFGILSDLGLQVTMARDLTEKPLPKKVFGTYFWIKVFLAMISVLLAIFFLLFLPYSSFIKKGIIIASFGIALGFINTFGTTTLQAGLRLDLVALVDVAVKIATVVSILLFIIWQKNFYFILNSILLGNLVGTAIIFLLLQRRGELDFSLDLSLAKKIIRRSAPVGIVSGLMILYFKIDTFLLSIFRNASEVGIYGLAYKIINNLMILWGFYMATTYPLLAGILNDKKIKLAKNIFKNAVRAAIALSTIIVLVGYFLAPLFIKILGGKEFLSAVFPFRILLFSLPLFFINNLFYHFFLLKKKISAPLIFITISLVINFFLNIIFIPKFGYISASINIIISQFILFLLYLLFGKVSINLIGYAN